MNYTMNLGQLFRKYTLPFFLATTIGCSKDESRLPEEMYGTPDKTECNPRVSACEKSDGSGNSLEGKIAFHSSRDGNREIYVMNADGSNQRNLTNHPDDDFHPAWSP